MRLHRGVVAFYSQRSNNVSVHTDTTRNETDTFMNTAVYTVQEGRSYRGTRHTPKQCDTSRCVGD